jgi:glucose-6-phosphate isomerase
MLVKKFVIDLAKKRLLFGRTRITASTRSIRDMKHVIDKEFYKKVDRRKIVYFMFRGVDKLNDLRYDITVIPPLALGRELAKTYGHYHPSAKGKLSFCEVYEVLSGRAHYLLQKKTKGGVSDVILVKAKEGDKVIVPPNYGHVTINPAGKTLVMANLVSGKFESDYGEYKKRGGAAYFELANGKIVANKRYKKNAKMRVMSADGFNRQFKAYKSLRKGGMLGIARKRPGQFRFLEDPTKLVQV